MAVPETPSSDHQHEASPMSWCPQCIHLQRSLSNSKCAPHGLGRPSNTNLRANPQPRRAPPAVRPSVPTTFLGTHGIHPSPAVCCRACISRHRTTKECKMLQALSQYGSIISVSARHLTSMSHGFHNDLTAISLTSVNAGLCLCPLIVGRFGEVTAEVLRCV